MTETLPQRLHLEDITLDPDCQPRAEIDQEVVNEYAAALDAGAEFPPVVVFDDGQVKRLVCGWHRYAAHEAADRDEIEVVIQDGDKYDAIRHSLTTNTDHGLRRSNADKRRVVRMALADPIIRVWSDREIARTLGVSNNFVSVMRREMFPPESAPEAAPDAEEPTQDEDPSFDDAGGEAEGLSPQEEDELGRREYLAQQEARQETPEPPDEAAQAVAVADDEFRPTMDRLKLLHQSISYLCNQPAGKAIDKSAMLKLLGEIRKHVQQAKPAKVCPKCHGRGCTACDNLGWLSQFAAGLQEGGGA
jgi:ParB-like chromosome segregation protein Spo0J